jgi:hypothetical protein
MNPQVDTKALMAWLACIVRGYTLRHPEGIQIRQHKSWLLINSTLAPLEGDDEDKPRDFVNICISKCKDWKFTPDSEVKFVDFCDEWPPYSFIRELDKPQLVTVSGRRLDG